MLVRPKLFILSVMLLLPATVPHVAIAQTISAATSVNPAEQQPAGAFIQDLGNQAIGVITDKSLGADQRKAKYGDILHNAFDLKTIGHFVIGRAWDSATPAQQQEYMQLFEQLVVKIYGDRLNFYAGEKFHVKGVRRENDKDVIVNSEIDHPDGSQPTTIDWRVRQKDDKLAVIDVMVEGVSQSVTQRQEYAAIIQRDGGKLDGLLAQMREQVEAPDTNH